MTVSSYKVEDPGKLAFNGGRPTKLHGPERLRITCAMEYQIASADKRDLWKVHTTNYIYRLLDRSENPIVDYHWHPDDTPDVPFPHLHLRKWGSRLHYPTGRVLVEDLLMLAVEHGAEPHDRAKWARILKRNRENFALGATWGVPRVPFDPDRAPLT
ncbi:MAG: hypothetical protein ACYCU7_09495 [Acidimicrobiales bacterium]